MIIETVLHHSGGVKANPLASSAHLTVQDIDRAHRDRWSFPSAYMRNGERPFYIGYNAVYDPKDGKFTQTRALGEETAHTVGHNFSSFGLCIIGNFSVKPDGSTVDPLTPKMVDDVIAFLDDLYDGNKGGLIIKPDTKVKLSIFRTHPHRFYQQTECYGFGIDNNFFVVEWFMRKYRSLKFAEFMAWVARLNPPVSGLAGENDRGCAGFI